MLRYISSLASSKRRFSYSFLDSAFTTRMPVMFSRMMRTTLSSFSWTTLNSGMPLRETKKMKRPSGMMMATRMEASTTSMLNIMRMPPSIRNGARTHIACRVWANCWIL